MEPGGGHQLALVLETNISGRDYAWADRGEQSP